ncbi:MAG: hypothetical protein V4555_19080 [Acidobacteriota bacterium]
MLKFLWKPLLMAVVVSGSAPGQMQHISVPAGKTLDKALKESTLGQAGARPFHVRLEISESKSGLPQYNAAVEETWNSPTEWRRTVTAQGLSQTTVVNASGTHFVTTGDYYPLWLRNFVTGLFTPVPDAEHWNKSGEPLEHIEMPNGGHSNPCQQEDFNLGVPPVEQVNFAHLCFDNGLLEMVQGPSYTVEFRDYAKFDGLKVARKLLIETSHHVDLVGRVTVLEPVKAANAVMFETPPGASETDSVASVKVDAPMMIRLAGNGATFKWPDPIPGKGMFTVWLSLDTEGVVREADPLNSDLSGLAADMAAQLVGRKWKGAMKNGKSVQAQGPMVFAYPPEAGGGQ